MTVHGVLSEALIRQWVWRRGRILVASNWKCLALKWMQWFLDILKPRSPIPLGCLTRDFPKFLFQFISFHFTPSSSTSSSIPLCPLPNHCIPQSHSIFPVVVSSSSINIASLFFPLCSLHYHNPHSSSTNINFHPPLLLFR